MKRIRLDRIKFNMEMLKQNMTQGELAEKTGISRATICYIANGKSCSNETAEKIAKALDVDVTEIIE